MVNLVRTIVPTPEIHSARSIPTPVIICDDHAAIRRGVSQMLTEEGIVVSGECDAVPVLLEMVEQFPDAIVITDLAIDEVPFPTLATMLRELAPNCQIVVYSMREAPSTIGICYEAGAIAFVPKRADLKDLAKAVEHAARGERYLSPEVASELANFHIDRKSPAGILSAREMEVFLAYARDPSIEKLAQSMSISDKTIQNMLSQVAKKLAVSRAMFPHVARQHGLLDLP